MPKLDCRGICDILRAFSSLNPTCEIAGMMGIRQHGRGYPLPDLDRRQGSFLPRDLGRL